MANALAINNAVIEQLTEQIKQKQENGLTVPADYSPNNALMGAYLWMKDHEDQMSGCSQPSIINALMDMVTMGLSVQKQQGYFIKYGTRCQFQRSYFGNVTIARRYGMANIGAVIIYKGDVFKYENCPDGRKRLVSHEQDFANIDNDNIVGAYAVVTMQDGDHYLEVMTMDQIKAAWRQSRNYREGGNGVHQKFPDQMCKKTVMNRALKEIVNTHGDSYVMQAMAETEEVDSVDVIDAEVTAEIEQNANAIPFEFEDVDQDIIEAEQAEFRELAEEDTAE